MNIIKINESMNIWYNIRWGRINDTKFFQYDYQFIIICLSYVLFLYFVLIDIHIWYNIRGGRTIAIITDKKSMSYVLLLPECHH